MKEKVITLGTLLCLVVLTSLLLVHALVVFPGVPAMRWFFVTSAAVLGRLDAPAWVQAVGSITAIVAAIWISSSQQARQERVRRRETVQRDAVQYRALLIEFTKIRAVLEQAGECLIGSAPVDAVLQEVIDCRAGMDRFPMFEFPNECLIGPFSSLHFGLKTVATMLQMKQQGQAVPQDALDILGRQASQAVEIEAICQRLAVQTATEVRYPTK